MAYRGRGRGRGGGGYNYAKQEPFVLFPDIDLPPKSEDSSDAKAFVKWSWSFRQIVQDSPYFLDETSEKKEESVEIEKYSDKKKKRGISNRESIANCGFIILEPGYFPLELVRGTKRRIGRKVQWNPKRDLKKLDMLAELEGKFEDDDPKSKKEMMKMKKTWRKTLMVMMKKMIMAITMWDQTVTMMRMITIKPTVVERKTSCELRIWQELVVFPVLQADILNFKFWDTCFSGDE